MFQISTTEIMKLQIDKELLREIRDKIAGDPAMQDTITKYQNGKWKDTKVALGLCQMQEGLPTHKGLLRIPDDDQLQLKLLHNHHDSPVAGHPG
jgi:hypothetical protein